MQPGKYRANGQRKKKVASPALLKGSHLPLKGGPSPGCFGAISGLGSGLLRWLAVDRFTPGFKLRFLSPNSSRKQHDDAALSSASPLETT